MAPPDTLAVLRWKRVEAMEAELLSTRSMAPPKAATLRTNSQFSTFRLLEPLTSIAPPPFSCVRQAQERVATVEETHHVLSLHR